MTERALQPGLQQCTDKHRESVEKDQGAEGQMGSSRCRIMWFQIILYIWYIPVMCYLYMLMSPIVIDFYLPPLL